jgi:hypothetical protein
MAPTRNGAARELATAQSRSAYGRPPADDRIVKNLDFVVDCSITVSATICAFAVTLICGQSRF